MFRLKDASLVPERAFSFERTENGFPGDANVQFKQFGHQPNRNAISKTAINESTFKVLLQNVSINGSDTFVISGSRLTSLNDGAR